MFVKNYLPLVHPKNRVFLEKQKRNCRETKEKGKIPLFCAIPWNDDVIAPKWRPLHKMLFQHMKDHSWKCPKALVFQPISMENILKIRHIHLRHAETRFRRTNLCNKFLFSSSLQTRDSIDSIKWKKSAIFFFFFEVDFLENGDRYVFFYFCSGLVNVSSTTLHIRKNCANVENMLQFWQIGSWPP